MANEKQNKIDEPTKTNESGHTTVHTAPSRSEAERSQKQPQYDSFMRVIRR